jgi:hypothetical protein
MQKIYIDPQTNMPTSVEVPALGRIKTNYPALVFVCLGIALSYVAFDKFHTNKELWVITGGLEIKSDRPELVDGGINWSDGDIVLVPHDLVSSTIQENGRFELSVLVESGLMIEDKFDAIQFTGHPLVFGHINLNDSEIENSGNHTRAYRFPVELAQQLYPEEDKK